jgi:ATP-dependent DNA helicase PIF1
MVFIDAPGGTGKTFLLNLVLAYVRKEKQVALATASSSIAATLLKFGRTAHSRFKLPIPPREDSVCNVSPRDATGCLLQTADLLVWDEAPTSH